MSITINTDIPTLDLDLTAETIAPELVVEEPQTDTEIIDLATTLLAPAPAEPVAPAAPAVEKAPAPPQVYVFHRAVGPIDLDEASSDMYAQTYMEREIQTRTPHTVAVREGWDEEGQVFVLSTGVLGQPLPTVRTGSGEITLGHHLRVYWFSREGALIQASLVSADRKGCRVEPLTVDADSDVAVFKTATAVAADGPGRRGPFFSFVPPERHPLVRSGEFPATAVGEFGGDLLKALGPGVRSASQFARAVKANVELARIEGQIRMLIPGGLSHQFSPRENAQLNKLAHVFYLGAWSAEARKQMRGEQPSIQTAQA